MRALQAPTIVIALSVLLSAWAPAASDAQAQLQGQVAEQQQGDIPGPSNEERAGLALPDLAGEWVIASSVGGRTPITVYCTLEQEGAVLSGSCTPEMENAEPSALRGSVGLKLATWGYGVVFNGAAGTVDFRATTLQPDLLEGMLSLSGTVAPFTAQRKQ
jgi:hypothetical protein